MPKHFGRHRQLFSHELSILPEMFSKMIRNRIIAIDYESESSVLYEEWLDENIDGMYTIYKHSSGETIISFENEADMVQFVSSFRNI